MKPRKKRDRVELSRGEWLDVIGALLDWSDELITIRTKDNRDDCRYPFPQAIAYAIRIRIRLHDDAETATDGIAVDLDLDHCQRGVAA